MAATAFDPTGLIASFKAVGGWIDESAVELKPVHDMGFGAIARRDIDAHTPLFHIPLDLLLSPWTATLRSHLSEAEWNHLEGGWARLILSMMWETHSGDGSKWAGYLDSSKGAAKLAANMPSTFDTPMFWGEADRNLLKGTDIEHIFAPGSPHFSLDAYHMHGSRVLSRSFTMPVTRAGGPAPERSAEEQDDESDEDDDEDDEPQVAVMVPMADMLNAAYERDNARLFAEDEDDAVRGEGYTMISTKAIKAGEQIYNTYDSPPNSELLRKYGHVDVLPLPADVAPLLEPAGPSSYSAWPFGNAGDEVEITGDKVVAAAAALRGSADGLEARVEWWLEEGEEDTFGLTLSPELDPGLVAFARLLTNDADWERAQRKGKAPKPELDASAVAVLLRVIADRASGYATSLEDDLAAITANGTALNARNAAVVRLGEKRILSAAVRLLESAGRQLETDNGEGPADKKRKAGSDGADGSRGKRQA